MSTATASKPGILARVATAARDYLTGRASIDEAEGMAIEAHRAKDDDAARAGFRAAIAIETERTARAASVDRLDSINRRSEKRAAEKAQLLQERGEWIRAQDAKLESLAAEESQDIRQIWQIALDRKWLLDHPATEAIAQDSTIAAERKRLCAAAASLKIAIQQNASAVNRLRSKLEQYQAQAKRLPHSKVAAADLASVEKILPLKEAEAERLDRQWEDLQDQVEAIEARDSENHRAKLGA